MTILLVSLVATLVAMFCAWSAAYCARIAKRLAPYKARWLRAVRLLSDLDEEMRALEFVNQEMSRLAHVAGDRNDQLAEVHRRVARELEEARATRLAAHNERAERAWAMLMRGRS